MSWALRHTKPVVLLLRTPRDTIISWHIYTGQPLEFIAWHYYLYYRILLPYKERVCLVTFEQLQHSFKQTIRACNKRFNLGLTELFDEQACQNAAFTTVDNSWTLPDGQIDQYRVGRPSQQRELLKENVETQFSTKCKSALIKADEVHTALIS